MQDRQDMPAVIPDCSVPKVLQADRVRLWRLFDQAAEVRCELELNLNNEPLALQVLADWSRDRGRAAEPIHHEGNEDCAPFTIWRCHTGMGRISVYSMGAK